MATESITVVTVLPHTRPPPSARVWGPLACRATPRASVVPGAAVQAGMSDREAQWRVGVSCKQPDPASELNFCPNWVHALTDPAEAPVVAQRVLQSAHVQRADIVLAVHP